MYHEYNIKKRVFSNGLCQVRVFQKAVILGNVKDSVKKIEYEMLEIPFEQEPVKSRKFLDSEGFSIPVEYDKDLVLKKSMKRTKDKVYDYANSNNWEWFCTFTFNQEKVNRFDFTDVSKKFSKWLEHMRQRYCKDMKYLVVPEKHKDGSYHFHGLFSNCKGLNFVPALNQEEFYHGKPNKYFGQLLIRDGLQVYDMKRFRLGFSDCTQVRDTKKVAAYILKYITKEMVSDVPNRKRYWVSRNLDKPKEQLFCVPLGDYDEFCQDLIQQFAIRNPDIHINECNLEHGDYTNKITYLTYDSNKCDVEFSNEILESNKE